LGIFIDRRGSSLTRSVETDSIGLLTLHK